MPGCRRIRFRLSSVLALSLILAGPAALAAASTPPVLAAPQIFAPGVVSGPANDESPAVSPDGNTMFFTRSGAGGGTIMETHRVHGHWSTPRIAPFSGTWQDLAPALSPDGSFLVYVSIRKTDTRPARMQVNLWRVDRIGPGWDHWSAPRRLPATVNIGNGIWKASVARDGSLYFLSIDAGKDKGKRLYVSRYVNGVYQQAQPLSFSHYGDSDVDPEIAADGSFMVFASDRRLAGDSKDHLFIVFRQGNGWGTPQAIRYAGDDAHGFSTDYLPHLAPDQRTLYFTSDRSAPVAPYPHDAAQARAYLQRVEAWDNGNLNAWSVSLTPLLDAQKHVG
ncbi:TolB family protein [Rhodanobacter glycinis]|uniref:WD40-like Beta Propeller Repeat n=1 Tax=Rhodanobacter glycinis TaxID=582702 RepID=A0A1I4E4Z7_9GAMM|nr:PD40 domain-containing protein [Rhodanobacter glycinis]SFL00343.1 WD40-like Beta Propeller Repeat [Rhodanobacter glycinis]